MSPKKEEERKHEFVDLVLRLGPCMFLEKKKRENPQAFRLFESENSQQVSQVMKVKNDDEASSSSSSQPDMSVLFLLSDAAKIVSVDQQQQQQKQKRKRGHLSQDSENKAEVGFELPEEFKQKIQDLNGSDIMFVLQKNLYKSDTNKNEGRLSIPPKKISIEFLTESEKSKLDERDEKNRIVGMDVLILDPCLRESSIRLKKWTMSRGSVYYLTGTWNNIVITNNLKVDDTVQLWSFRMASKLCFALVKV